MTGVKAVDGGAGGGREPVDAAAARGRRLHDGRRGLAVPSERLVRLRRRAAGRVAEVILSNKEKKSLERSMGSGTPHCRKLLITT